MKTIATEYSEYIIVKDSYNLNKIQYFILEKTTRDFLGSFTNKFDGVELIFEIIKTKRLPKLHNIELFVAVLQIKDIPYPPFPIMPPRKLPESIMVRYEIVFDEHLSKTRGFTHYAIYEHRSDGKKIYREYFHNKWSGIERIHRILKETTCPMLRYHGADLMSTIRRLPDIPSLPISKNQYARKNT